MTSAPAVALVALSHHVLNLFAEGGRNHGVTQQQAELLCVVGMTDRVRMAELGRLLHMEKSGLSNLVDRAEQRGLAVRTRDTTDRRGTWVELTDEGSRVGVQVHNDVVGRLDELVAHLPPEDQEQLVALIEKVLAGPLLADGD
ncbi:transcriptional regulator [Pseudonocardia sp. CNS-139]|nr:transcriptional regulator [Pseudonocardia sp. CNS-139]